MLIADLEAQSEYRFRSGPIGLRNFRLRAEYEDLAGDVSGDRLVNEEDATQILNHALGLESIADFALELADVSLNGEVTRVSPYDASWILRYDSDLVESFPASSGPVDDLSGIGRSVHLSEPTSN